MYRPRLCRCALSSASRAATCDSQRERKPCSSVIRSRRRTTSLCSRSPTSQLPNLLDVKVVSATSYGRWRRAALIVPRPRWKPSDLPPTQAPVGGMLHWHAQAARSTASTPRMMQCCSSLTQRCSSATE
eukprot:scaffold9486_cov67-Phaeocystis_antarctica.AAC.1